MLQFSPKQTQTIVRQFRDNTLEVLEGSPRSGKTTAGVFRFARYLMETEDENHLVLGFSQDLAYKLLIDGDGLGLRYIFNGSCKLKDDNGGKHLLIDTPTGQKKVYYKNGGNNASYKSFQGMSFGSVYFCEIDLITMPTIQEAFRRTFASKLRVHFADLNPPAPQHPVIKEVFEVQNTIWTHWTIDDNPIITADRKAELFRILSKNNFLLERDWYGHRVLPQGVIYSMFSHTDNMVQSIPQDEEKIEMFFSGDGGLKDATAILCFIVTRRKDNSFCLYLMNQWHYSGSETGQTRALSDQAREIATQFVPYCINRQQMQYGNMFIDPACLALREELEKQGIATLKADNNGHDMKGNRRGLVVGIERLQSLIADRMVFLVEPAEDIYTHYDFLKELTLYVRDEHGNPVDMYNHHMDAWRYGANYFIKTYVPDLLL